MILELRRYTYQVDRNSQFVVLFLPTSIHSAVLTPTLSSQVKGTKVRVTPSSRRLYWTWTILQEMAIHAMDLTLTVDLMPESAGSLSSRFVRVWTVAVFVSLGTPEFCTFSEGLLGRWAQSGDFLICNIHFVVIHHYYCEEQDMRLQILNLFRSYLYSRCQLVLFQYLKDTADRTKNSSCTHNVRLMAQKHLSVESKMFQRK